MGDELEYDRQHEVVFNDQKSLESGLIYGHPIDSIYFKFNYPDARESLTIIMTEAEALAVVHMLSGTLLTSIAEQVDEDGDYPGSGASGNGNGPQELGSGYPDGATASDN